MGSVLAVLQSVGICDSYCAQRGACLVLLNATRVRGGDGHHLVGKGWEWGRKPEHNKQKALSRNPPPFPGQASMGCFTE